MLTRRGFSLVELLVAMTVGGIVLAMIGSVSLRQQRIFADLADQNALASQLRDAASSLPIDLRALSPPLGDIREARDTSLEIRATIATAIVCDTTRDAVILPPAAAGEYYSQSSAIETDDTLWLYSAAGSVEQWLPHRIAAVAAAPAGNCSPLGPPLSPPARATPRTALTLSPPPPSGAALGMPFRITRPLRYSLYRASDGAWYVGEREWNGTLARFDVIQPVAGPFLSASARGLAFRYLDSTGAPIAAPVTDPSHITLVSLDLRGQTRSLTRILGAAQSTAKRIDSLLVVVAPRNRR